MKRFFEVLLVVGIILTLSSIYFVTRNSVYAVFASTIGVLITAFSIFEIITLKKGIITPGKKVVKTKNKGTLEEGIEWTYYDIGEKSSVSRAVETKKGKKPFKMPKFTFIRSILSALNIFKRLKPFKLFKKKIPGKIIEAETKDGVAMIEKEDKETKKASLKAYIMESLKNEIPREKIIESALASDWPENIVIEMLKKVQKSEKKSLLKLIYSLAGVTLLLFIILLSTGNFIIGYWINVISKGFPIIYFSLIGAMTIGIGILIMNFRKTMKEKKKIYKIAKAKRVSEIKEKLAGTEIKIEGDRSHATVIDQLLDLVNEKESLSVDEVADIFNVSKNEAESWGKILKDQGLITLHYPTVGEVELRCKKEVKKEEE